MMDQIHHIKLKEAYIGRKEWWEQETTSWRCKVCWLRRYQCYCSNVVGPRDHFATLFSLSEHYQLNIYMYYHHLELGRSANTAHIFDALCSCVVTPLVYGDEQGEHNLMNQIALEHKNGINNTCILYPRQDSLLIPEWIEENVRSNTSGSNKCDEIDKRKVIRIIVLDGTYACASRMAKALINMREAYAIPEKAFPFVKLDVSENGLRSAVAGIMYQPGKFKICSYQAIVIAIKEVYEALNLLQEPLIPDLLKELDNWIAYIVKTKIKFTKAKQIKSINDVDNLPAEHIQSIVVSDDFSIITSRPLFCFFL